MMPTVKGRRADHTAHAVHHQTHPCVVWASADPELRDEVAHILAEDFEVIDVPDGAMALQAVHEHLPELVLSDVGMPHVDGFGLLVALRADPRTCSLPVIFVVDQADAARPTEGVAPAADGHVVMPLDAPELLARVHTLIARSHTQRAWAIERERARQELSSTDPGSHRRAALSVPTLAQVEQCELRRESLDLTAIARGIAAELRARDPGRVVDVRVSDGMSATGDRQLVTIALEILLGNAWKLTSEREHAEIAIEPRDEGVFIVRDTGAGLDPALSEQLLHAFHRPHPSSDIESAKLDLAIVGRIIERHGGDVWTRVIADGGVAIWFTLGPGSDPLGISGRLL